MSTHTAESGQLFHRVANYTVAFGVVNVILGAVMLAWPLPSLVVAAVLFGVYLAASGISQFVMAVSLPVASAGGRVLLLLSGAASIILAVLAFRHFGEGYAILLLAIWIAIGFIFRGVSATAAAISDPAYPGRGLAIFFGVISVIAGVVVLAYPFDSTFTLTVFAGAWLVIIGVMEIVSGFGLRNGVRRIASDAA
jgi:uncharacterized membrane protein HdeD (DUF308 family)